MCLVLHPRSNGTVKCIEMDKERLKVRTVPVHDLITQEVQTLFTVQSLRQDMAGHIRCASGMSLRDAITSFCNWFKTDRQSVELLRPFRPHGWEENDKQ